MSLQTQLNSFVLRVAEEFNTVKGRTGTLTALTTTDKSSLVAAINELKAATQLSSRLGSSRPEVVSESFIE